MHILSTKAIAFPGSDGEVTIKFPCSWRYHRQGLASFLINLKYTNDHAIREKICFDHYDKSEDAFYQGKYYIAKSGKFKASSRPIGKSYSIHCNREWNQLTRSYDKTLVEYFDTDRHKINFKLDFNYKIVI